MQGVTGLIAQQVERAWQLIGVSVTPGTTIRPSMVHKLFPPTEKVLLVRFQVGLAGGKRVAAHRVSCFGRWPLGGATPKQTLQAIAARSASSPACR